MKMFRILGPITAGFGQQFADFISALAADEQYGIEVNSPGGSVDEGMYVYRKMLARPPARALVHQAASMAALLVQTALVRSMARDGHMILHNPVATMSGNADELKQAGKYVGELEQEMTRAYEKRAKEAPVAELMKSEKPLTAKEAINMGLADEVAPALDLAAQIVKPPQQEKPVNPLYRLIAKVLGVAEDKVSDDTSAQALLEAKAALIANFETEQAKLKSDADRQAVIAEALKAGRMTEAMSKLEAVAKLDATTLKALVDTLPVVVPLARADLSNLARPADVSGFDAAGLKLLQALHVDPAEAAKVAVPRDGIFRHVVPTKR